MKRYLLLMGLIVWTCGGACSPEESYAEPDPQTGQQTAPDPGTDGTSDGGTTPDEPDDGTPNVEAMKVKVTIGGRTFSATLENNPAAEAFAALLPLDVMMTELNGNEKYFDLPASLPTDSCLPGTIHAGDLLLWGSRTVVLFYETFSSSYSYTRLGRLDDPTGLASAVGRGHVRVSFTR